MFYLANKEISFSIIYFSELSPAGAAAGFILSSSFLFISSLIRYSRLIEDGWPVKLMFPHLSTKQTKGIPIILKSFIKPWSFFHPSSVRWTIFYHFLLIILYLITSLVSSTLTPIILTLFPQIPSFFLSISWLCFIGFWQGPHQVAQTSTSNTSPGLWASWVLP